jgi:serine/threonine protein kinase
VSVTDPYKLVGAVVDGRYRVEAVAGHGGHAVVYRALHLWFESPIALKVLKLPADLRPHEAKAKVAEFRREGRLLFGLSSLHASIVRAFEAGVMTCDGALAPYLALEWLHGVSLDREIKHRRQGKLAPFSLREVVELLDWPARGLGLAHAQGLVHRDIKPHNLFATVQAEKIAVKIVDFGISKWLDLSLSTTGRFADTGPRRSSFTPMYGAPEQWLHRLGGTGPWTDVHAWALVCVELLSGRPPFAGEEPAQFMAACLDSSARPTPRNRGVPVNDEVEAIFSRALAVEPRERFRDLRAFWTSLCRSALGSDAPSNAKVALHSIGTGSRAFENHAPGGDRIGVSVPPAGRVADDASDVDRQRSRTTAPSNQRDAMSSLSAQPGTITSGARQPKIKGVAFRTLDLCFERLRGEAARSGARDLMPHELSDAFRYRTLLAANWYPVSWYRETLRAFRAMTKEGPELARELGRLTARHDMSGVYKQITARLISPQALLALSQRLFHTYYDTGDCQILESHPGFAHVRCTNCAGWDHNVWMEFAGSCESLINIAGGDNPRVRVISGGRDDQSHIDMQLHWSQ